MQITIVANYQFHILVLESGACVSADHFMFPLYYTSCLFMRSAHCVFFRISWPLLQIVEEQQDPSVVWFSFLRILCSTETVSICTCSPSLLLSSLYIPHLCVWGNFTNWSEIQWNKDFFLLKTKSRKSEESASNVMQVSRTAALANSKKLI